MLLDDVLLEVFEHCRKMHYNLPRWTHDSIWNWFQDWLILVHVCRRWRQVIFESPHRLKLQIICTYGTPFRTNLDIWPVLPIVLDLSSRRCMPLQDRDNAIAVLGHRNRVQAVRLSGTDFALRDLVAVMQEPFPVLTHLHLRTMDAGTPILTTEFLGGSAPHLQEITLYRILFPALPTFLLSTTDLVTLNLFDIPTPGYISPEGMVECLAALPRLEMFAIKYQHVSSRPDRIRPSPVTRPVLPALTDFEFRGGFEYLENLVAQIDSPRLERISIYYLDLPDNLQVAQLSNFIDRSIGPELTPSRRAHVRFLSQQVAFALSRDYPHARYPGRDRRTVETTISIDTFGDFNWHISDMARVLSQFSVALHTVVHLELEARHDEYDRYDQFFDPHDVEWLDLFIQFPAMRVLYVSPDLANAPILSALKGITAETAAKVLPSLGLIYLDSMPTSDLGNIIAIRRFSDHPITVAETLEEFDERLESYVSG